MNRRGAARRLAELISSVTRLPVLATLLFFAVGWEAGGPGGLLWALLCVLLTTGLSLLYLYHLVRTGRVRDPRRILRSERIGPLRVVAALYVAAFLLVTVLGGPAPLQAMLLAFALATVLLAAATPLTNPSLHTAGVSGAAICVSYVFGAWGVPVALLIPPVWWARSTLQRHTPLELALGMLVGTGATWAAFELLV
ncbi:MAG: hypothetical protein IN808_08090 [Rubrobacter sp.]|nr:hypothetical protein [Rubrobacter sp.]